MAAPVRLVETKRVCKTVDGEFFIEYEDINRMAGYYNEERMHEILKGPTSEMGLLNNTLSLDVLRCAAAKDEMRL